MRAKIVYIIIFIILSNSICFAYDNKITHFDLSGHSASFSLLAETDLLKEYGFNKNINSETNGKKIKYWVSYGADLEDAGSDFEAILGKARFKNHFHNPLKNWSDAGLSDIQNGMSMVLWAQDSQAQSNAHEGDYSWHALRNYYYGALIGKDDNFRQENFAQLFKGLGHQIHLVQDSGQPDHVRNDAHPLDGKGLRIHVGYEKWAKDQRSYINNFASSPLFPQVSFNISSGGLVPISQLIDSNIYTGANPSASLSQGLAEYANANFYTDDTIFAAERFSPGDKRYFPYPKMSSTNVQDYVDGLLEPEELVAPDGSKEYSIWIKKIRDGETIDHLVRGTYFSRIVRDWFGDSDLFRATFYRDEKCHIDYAQKLIPRAVGYSAALIDYFFRGIIDMVADLGNDSQCVIKNKSEESMSGTFSLYYDDKDGNRKRVAEDAEWNLSITAKGTSIPVTFTAPSDAKEAGKYMLVFQGRLGAEEEAVVGKVVELQSGPEVRVVTVSKTQGYIDVYTKNGTIHAEMPTNRFNVRAVRFDLDDYNRIIILASPSKNNWEYHEYIIDETNQMLVHKGVISTFEPNVNSEFINEKVLESIDYQNPCEELNGEKIYCGGIIYLSTEKNVAKSPTDFYVKGNLLKKFGTIFEETTSALYAYSAYATADGQLIGGGWHYQEGPLLSYHRSVKLIFGDFVEEMPPVDCNGGDYSVDIGKRVNVTGCQPLPASQPKIGISPLGVFNENDYAYAIYSDNVLQEVVTTLPIGIPQSIRSYENIKTMLRENGEYSFYTIPMKQNNVIPLQSFSSDTGTNNCYGNLITKIKTGDRYLTWNKNNGLIEFGGCNNWKSLGTAQVYIGDNAVYDVIVK